MKIIDENGRLFGKISVVDLLVIALVLVLAAALYVKNALMNADRVDEPELPEQAITFQVRADAMSSFVYRALHVGDQIWDQGSFDGEHVLGVITDIEVTSDPGTVAVPMHDGTIARLEAEDTVDLLITIQGSGVVKGRVYFINGNHSVGVNSNRNYVTRLAKFTGAVANVY